MAPQFILVGHIIMAVGPRCSSFNLISISSIVDQIPGKVIPSKNVAYGNFVIQYWSLEIWKFAFHLKLDLKARRFRNIAMKFCAMETFSGFIQARAIFCQMQYLAVERHLGRYCMSEEHSGREQWLQARYIPLTEIFIFLITEARSL